MSDSRRPLLSSQSGSREAQGFSIVRVLVVVVIVLVVAILADFARVVTTGPTHTTPLTPRLITQLHIAIELHYRDQGAYPAQTDPTGPEENQFSSVYDTLFPAPGPIGSDGRKTPPLQVAEDQIVVWDASLNACRKAKFSERNDPDVEKFVADEWGEPLIYRCNKGRAPQAWMRNTESFDLYSKGIDGIDQTALGLDDESDDIGNW